MPVGLAESAPPDSSTSKSLSAQPAELAPAPAAKRATTTSEEQPQRQTSRGLRFVLDAPLGVAGWGSLPGPAFGLGAGLGVRWKSLRVTARAELWQPQSHRVSGFDTRFTLQSGGLDACLIHELQGVEIAPCLGAAVQRLTGAGVASQVLSAVAEPQVTWISGAGGLFASLPTPGFAHLRFFGAASVLLSPARPRFVIDQLGPVHQPALAAPRLDLGCEWIF